MIGVRPLAAAERAALVDGLVDGAAAELVDVDGRPLGEVSSAAYDPATTEIAACPYADRRRGEPMNLTALAQLSGCWRALLGTVAALAGPSPTVHRAWWVATTCIAAPLVGPRPVPVELAALYKTALGLSQATAALLLADDGVADVPLVALGDEDAFFAFLDDGEWLFGQVQVCAGSGPQIRQMYAALAGLGAPVGGVGPAFAALPGGPEIGAVGVEVVGLQAAYLTATRRAVRAGRAEGLDGSPAERWLQTPPPWLRALVAVPNRPIAHVLRLFPAGGAPPRVARFLTDVAERPERDAGDLGRAFAEAVAALAVRGPERA